MTVYDPFVLDAGASQGRLPGMAAVIGRTGLGQGGRMDRLPSLLVSVAAHVLVIYAILHVPMQVVRPLAMKAITITISAAKPAEEVPPEKPKLKAPEAPSLMRMPDVIAPPITNMTILAAPPAPTKVSEAKPVESDTTPPRFDADYLNNPGPVYPNMSRRLRETGTVELRVRVSIAGLPMDVTVAKSSGYARLDDAALSAVRKWKFDPAQRGGAAVEDWVIVPLAFRL